MTVGVRINRPPFSVRLHGWGRADTGWWGCVSWQQRVRTGEGDSEVPFAAWVPAACLSLPEWSSGASELPRLRLDADLRTWPAPRGWPSWYVGVWLDGDVTCPPGVQIVTGAAWRKTPKLSPDQA